MTGKYDIVGVGFGPSNIALAVALEEKYPDSSYIFLEKKSKVDWQPNMLLSGSDIQNNPLRDLVTPRNPKSHYGFVNYLKEQGRLFDFLNLPLHYPLRSEYAEYVRWVASHFSDKVVLNSEVETVHHDRKIPGYPWLVTSKNGEVYYAKTIVWGTGRAPNIPDIYQPHLGSSVFHLNDFESNITVDEDKTETIAVLGASQSAVEIMLDLANRYPNKKVVNIQRGFGFRLKDTSPFSDHVYFPEFVSYYHSLTSEKRKNLDRQLRGTNYSSADADVINALYVKIYEEKLHGKKRISILNNTEVRSIEKAVDGKIIVGLHEVNTEETSTLAVDKFVLATGFKDIASGEKGEKYPGKLHDVYHLLNKDIDGVVVVERNYEVKFVSQANSDFYLNGLCESSHGLGDAGSFSLLSIRSAVIADAIYDHEKILAE